MLSHCSIQRVTNTMCKHFFPVIKWVVRLLISCFWDLCVWAIFMVSNIFIVIGDGDSLLAYILMGATYILAVGWRGMRSSHPIRSYGMLPCYLPAPLFVMAMWLTFTTEVSDFFVLVELVALVALARAPLFIKVSAQDRKRWSVVKKIVFFIGLQGLYGVSFQFCTPLLFEPFRWPLGLSEIKPTHQYPSATPIQFFYEEREDADKIEAQLPDVLNVLQSSPFYQNAESLVLIQKPHMVNLEFIDTDFDHLGGMFFHARQYSYYFTAPNQGIEPDMIYYAYNNRHHSVVIHELAHQLVSRFYGKWIGLVSIPTWKQEGYAEYLASTGCYGKKSELRAILYEYALSDKTVQYPFSQDKKINYEAEDYMGAFLQTRYALDVKKISPLAFMKRSYHAVSAQEIRDWLEQDN